VRSGVEEQQLSKGYAVDLGIRGRKAIIAGGSAGMGRATASALAREGVEVLSCARNEVRLQAAATSLAEETGGIIGFVCADHSTKEGRAAILAACPEPDILITTVSPPADAPDFRTILEEDWTGTFRSGVLGPIELIRSVVDGMAARKWGRIVNITTIASKFPAEVRLLSGAPRAALANYTSVVARKLAKDNVTINNLLPGMYLTEGFRSKFDWPESGSADLCQRREAEFVRQWRIPSRRIGAPEDFGRMAALFCADFANYVVGQNVVIDGGLGPGLF
jgi:3-oxoacyl-[acyl-carrier protein] reductase